MVKWLVILVALAGLAMGIWTVATSGEKLARPAPAEPPSVNPYAHGIAASGFIEAASRNIAIAAPEAALVTRVFVEVNDRVKRGDPLFELDRRPLESDLLRSRSALAVEEAEVARLAASPRAEDLPPLKAAVEEAKVRVADAEDQLARTRDASGRGAATAGELARREFGVQAARAALAAAQANLDRTQAGSWKQDVAVAKAKAEQARAEIQALEVRLERLTVRAPIDCEVLNRTIEPGEYASTSSGSPAAMTVGDVSTLHVRAQVDEEDAPQLRPGERGAARIRGSVPYELPLRMIRIEPWAQGKKQITGDTTERVDTRVVEVVFELQRPPNDGGPPLFLGQMVDVFIETPASTTQPSTRPLSP